MMVTDSAKGTLLNVENGISEIKTSIDNIKTQVENIRGSGTTNVANIYDLANLLKIMLKDGTAKNTVTPANS